MGVERQQWVIAPVANGFLVNVNYDQAYVFSDKESVIEFLNKQLSEVPDGSIHKL